MKRRESGFTMMEMLIVLGILMLLVGLLLPAIAAVRNIAKETKQKAQFTTIELALAAFKNDHGDYPPSSWPDPTTGDTSYCGAQKLAEALLGWDLLGFHPDTAWRSNGLDTMGGNATYDPAKTRDLDADGNPDTMVERKGPYLELATTNAFKLRSLFWDNVSGPLTSVGPGAVVLEPETYVLCDAFAEKKVRLANGKIVKAGAPILYYRANTSQQLIRGRYNAQDNEILIQRKQAAEGNATGVYTLNPLILPDNNYQYFYEEYIRDPKIEARVWPYRPDSYLLISAGADGRYGTADDIRNFGN